MRKVVRAVARQEGLGTLTDTFFAFTYPMRAQQESDYVGALVSKKIVTDDFVKDVLDVDITRPIFSSTSCGLLDFAPKADASTMTAAQIHDGFVDALKKAGADKKNPDKVPAAKVDRRALVLGASPDV
jgi:hypothetical protein